MRTGFRDKKNVPLDSLLLDEHNPRLGYAPDQGTCLAKMISFGASFFAIAKDIAENGLTIEPIVVLKQRNKLIVKDGNRRISALKLLNRPYLCAEKSVQDRFERLARLAEEKGNLTYSVDCQIGEDAEAVNEYISRIHTGENGGVGRKQWGSLQQEYYQLSIGEKGNYWRAAKLLLWADQNDIEVPEDIAITTMGRYFNAQKNIRLLGFDFDESDELEVQASPIVALAVVKRLIDDLQTGKVHVKRSEENGSFSMMSAPGREHYIEVVRRELGLDECQPLQSPGAETGKASDKPQTGVAGQGGIGGGQRPGNGLGAAASNATGGTSSPSGSGAKNGSMPTTHSANRAKYVTKGGHPLVLPKDELKLRDIYKELTVLEKCPVAGMMLVRAFVEGSFRAYVVKFQLGRGSVDSISIKDMLRLIKNKLVRDGRISEGNDYYQKIEDLLNGQFLSIPSMQKYIHSEMFNPRDDTVKNTWDDFYHLLKLVWGEIVSE
ncbi:ParB N-terminal domain-containing protein [Pseudomonas chlororaphis]|uniref:ParB N-terminal domain-containing protein n=1 Tax=Pseudomonas chlororaphis TaxID=587753 RepID=UPI000A77D32E|nr:ParB N-terminal domain-containing protein [Pseudomonas chlororaphis]